MLTSVSYCSARRTAWPNSVLPSASIFFSLLWECLRSEISWDKKKEKKKRILKQQIRTVTNHFQFTLFLSTNSCCKLRISASLFVTGRPRRSARSYSKWLLLFCRSKCNNKEVSYLQVSHLSSNLFVISFKSQLFGLESFTFTPFGSILRLKSFQLQNNCRDAKIYFYISNKTIFHLCSQFA